jgi:Spy/CpxP family protein refolding chaperone
MGQAREQRFRLREQLESADTDYDAARKAYAAMADAHKQMFDIRLDARKRIESVLSQEQREQLRQGARGWWGAPHPGRR